MRKGHDIAGRLIRLGAESLKLAAQLPKDVAAAHVAKQLGRAATGAGANYEEARGAESRRDFVHKLGVTEKELRETSYWIALVAARWEELAVRTTPISQEVDELISIVVASIRTARRNDERP